MPVILLIVAEDSEVLFQSLVCTFGLTITFRVITRDCHGLLYPAGYSRRVQQGTGTGWVYPTLALPVPPAGGWRVGGGSAHSNSVQKACQWSTQTTSDASYVGKFSYLFLIFLPTTQAHEGPQRPMKANTGQQKPTAANDGQQRPTQCVFFHFLFFILITTRQRPPHPSLANTSQGWVYSPPPPHHQQHHQQPTMANKGQRWPPKANAGPRKPTAANKGQRRSTKTFCSF